MVLAEWARVVLLGSGALAGGLFLLSSFFAACGLLRSDVKSERFLSGLACASLGVGCWMFPGESALNIVLPGYAAYLTLGLFSFWLEGSDSKLHQERSRRQPEYAARVLSVPDRPWLRAGLLLVFAGSSAAFAMAVWQIRLSVPRFQWLDLLALVLLNFLSLAAVVARKVLQAKLPEQESFDRWSYRAAFHALPWLTIHLVSGAVWAYDAWGSYWAWQPEQAWAFIAWLYLAMMLHLEQGKSRTAAIGSAGLFVAGAAIWAAGVSGF